MAFLRFFFSFLNFLLFLLSWYFFFLFFFFFFFLFDIIPFFQRRQDSFFFFKPSFSCYIFDSLYTFFFLPISFPFVFGKGSYISLVTYLHTDIHTYLFIYPSIHPCIHLSSNWSIFSRSKQPITIFFSLLLIPWFSSWCHPCILSIVSGRNCG